MNINVKVKSFLSSRSGIYRYNSILLLLLIISPIISYSQTADYFDVRLLDSNVIFATSKQHWMTMKVARPFCSAINGLSLKSGARSLVVNLNSMSKASPRAGMYGLKQMKRFNVQHIALFGGGGFIRGFAKTVLSVARFHSFSFFKTEEEALAWAEKMAVSGERRQ